MLYVYLLLLCLGILAIRFFYVLRKVRVGCIKTCVKRGKVKLMIVVGSGGHTHEILQLVSSLRKEYEPRIYVIANTDEMSHTKVHFLEQQKSDILKNKREDCYLVETIPRSREVKQSYITSIWSTSKAFLYSVPLVTKHRPDVVLCNGPGTCIPICIAAFLLNVLGLTDVIIINVESICRVQTLSLSGKILYYIANEFIVQWPQLQKKFPRSKYLGRLV